VRPELPIDFSGTIPRMFAERVRLSGRSPAIFSKAGGRFSPLTYADLETAVRETAAGLISLGAAPGDRVAIVSHNRPEWAVADLAILSAGGVTVPVYHTSTRSQTDWILQRSGARFAFVSRSEKAEMLLTCDASLETMIALDPVGSDDPGPCAMDYGGLRRLGSEALAKGKGGELERRIAAGKPDDCATVVFTSGTTGEPKGVMLSHGNLLANAADGFASQPMGEGDLFLSFLPLSHLFERTIGHFMMLLSGIPVAYAESVRTVAKDARLIRPTLMLAVPRFLEKLHEKIEEKLASAPLWRRLLFRRALAVGRRRVLAEIRGDGPGMILRLLSGLADRLVFRKVREGLGGRLRFIVCGGAPLAAELTQFFLSAGLEVLEGYGLSEASPVISVNRLGKARPGTVGVPFDHAEVRIGEDGEVLVRGPSVMLGYYGDPEATAEVVRDGWLHTGDLGVMEEGSLRITGRKKDIIVTSGGKNVAPQRIEKLLEADGCISQVVVYGDRRKYLTALVVPDYACLRREMDSREEGENLSDGELAGRREVYDLLMSRIEKRSRELASYERVKKIAILEEPLTEERGEVTPTMKVRREKVTGEFRDRLEALYGSG
jgi:long-chain acyl-CoA synthetase